MFASSFSCQPDERPDEVNDVEYRWMLVDEFIKSINLHRQQNFAPSGKICVDELIIQWYGLGSGWICKGLPHFVAMDRKPNDGCEVQNSCCGESGIMMRLKIVKGTLSSTNDLTTPPINTDGALELDSNNNAGTNTVLELTKPL